ncbi:hypothetical protein L1N85_24610 [Paenibacillus alkaliterrae]|uniref:hypothetical protein n=1 Tax=Paenibacillus alkaliterrae TaxID=320909 RepID=UPI001F2D3330|nr:hypothetical protein [Paenibacillus alkaliterrae]MCF2941524.1 hypothetical protein [Paenibacillus alkaliterrae]
MNPHFKSKAENKERAFFRKFGKVGYTFHTVKGKRPNIIQKVTSDFIYVTTEKSKRPNRIPRSSLRRALAFLFYRRVTTLKALIKINSFSSALAGLIKTIMIDICRVSETKTGAVRLSLRGLRYIFSGVSKAKDDVRIVKQNGGTFILLNFVNIRSDLTDSWKLNLQQLGFDYKCVILDPGAKTIAEAEQKGKFIKPIDLDAYAEFVTRHSDIIFQYLTLDIIGDPETTRRNTLFLERAVGRKPIPIFHVQNSLDVLEEMIGEDHEVIAIGGSVLVSRSRRAEVFAEIFNRFGDRANFHALGLGTTHLLMRYPWFSADASSWLNGRIFRTLISITGDVKAPAGMTSEEALGFNVRTLAALEDRYADIQMDFGLMPPAFGAVLG